DDHHQAPAEQVDIHLLHADAAQARNHFRPDAPVMLAIPGDGCLSVAQIDRQHMPREARPTFCRDSPRRSMPSATTSPGARYTGDGFIPSPTPAGVPVLMTSPGKSVMNSLT